MLIDRAHPDDNSGMDEKPTKRGGGAVPVVILLVVLILLPMIYVLSVGPVLWMSSHDLIGESCGRVIETIYRPLEWVVKVPVIGSAIVTYMEWWLPQPLHSYSAPTTPSATTTPAPALPAGDIVPAADALPAPLPATASP